MDNVNVDIQCEDISEYLDDVKGKKFKLVMTSPPYNIGKEYENKNSLNKYLEWQGGIVEKLVNILDISGSLCWQVGNYVEKGEIYPLDLYFYPLFKQLGLKLRNRIIWHFNHGLHASKRLSGRYETLLWFTKSDNYVFNLDSIRVPAKYPGKRHYKGNKKGQLSCNPKGKNPSDFWEIFLEEELKSGIIDIPNVKANHPEKTTHPCQFPVELVERCILAFTNNNDWVLDPFGGTGSTAIAAIKNGRNVVCVDKERKYCDIAEDRIKKLRNDTLKLRPLGKPLHQPTSN